MTRQEELRAMVAEATPGPRKGDPVIWDIFWFGSENKVCDIKARFSEIVICETVEARNAALIAQAPTIAAELATALDQLAAVKAEAERLREALQGIVNAVCGPTGFAEAVRHNTGLALPWPSLDTAEASARAVLDQEAG